MQAETEALSTLTILAKYNMLNEDNRKLVSVTKFLTLYDVKLINTNKFVSSSIVNFLLVKEGFLYFPFEAYHTKQLRDEYYNLGVIGVCALSFEDYPTILFHEHKLLHIIKNNLGLSVNKK